MQFGPIKDSTSHHQSCCFYFPGLLQLLQQHCSNIHTYESQVSALGLPVNALLMTTALLACKQDKVPPATLSFQEGFSAADG